MRRILRAAFLLLAMSFAVAAHPDPVAPQFELKIPRQPLPAALQELGITTRLNIGYMIRSGSGEDVPLAGPLEGRYTVESALSRLLADTGLTYTWLNSTTINITKVGKEPRIHTLQPVEGSSPAAPKTTSRSGAEASVSDAQSEEDAEFDLPEMLVSATKLLNRDIKRSRDDIQPYVVFDRKTIEEAGAKNIEDFLRQRLTMATQGFAANQIATRTGNVSRISLRGLTAEETLILVDGRHLASYSFIGAAQQPDVNGIPLSAVERIEVLPASASGIYGGSATAGVVNIILRRDYAGVEAKVTYGNTFDSDAGNGRVDLSAGISLEDGRTNIMISGSYAEAGDLQWGERELLQNARARILANNPNFFRNATIPPLGMTTNIRSSTGVPLTLKAIYGGTPLNSPFTSIPQGYAGVVSDNGAGLLANAGTYNLDLADTAQGTAGARQSLVNDSTVKSLLMTVRREFTPNVHAFLEFAGADNAGEYLTNVASSTFTLPATAAANPFNQAIRVTTPAFGADRVLDSSLESRRVAGGVTLSLPASWQLGMDYTWSSTEFSSSIPTGFAFVGIAPAPQPSVQNGTIDVMRDTNVFPVDFSSFVLPPTTIDPVKTTLQDVAINVGGPLWRLPGGPISLTARLEHLKEAYDQMIERSWGSLAGPPDEVLYPSRTQTVDSAYLEARVPIFSSANRIPGINLLELQLAGRHDEYEVVGANVVASVFPEPVVRVKNELSSSNPLVGLKYQPIRDVTLRASYATGFLPPRSEQLVPASPVPFPALNAAARGMSDPRRGNELLGDTIVTSGGSPDLKPEESESVSAGVILEPRFIPNLRLSVDWTQIKKTDVVALFGVSQALIEQEPFLPVVTRAAAAPGDPFGVGPITELHANFFNISDQEVEAYDIALDYQWSTDRLGAFALRAAATRNMYDRTQVVASAPEVENIDRLDELKWLSNGGLSWDYGPWRASWVTRYYDSYLVGVAGAANTVTIANQGSIRVPSQTYHDLFASYRFDGQTGWSFLSGTEIQLIIKNVLDKEPPVDMGAGVGALYSSWGDPRLAAYYLTLRKTFD